MTDEQKAAYVIANASAALIEAMGMAAENANRNQKGLAQAYGEGAFFNLIGNHDLHCNSIMALFHDIYP